MPQIRERMTNPKFISFEEHQSFINGLRNNTDTKYYCVIQQGHFIGSVNYHLIDERTIERGIFLNPQYTGSGLSKSISLEFYSYLHRFLKIETVKTKVKRDNDASNGLQRSLGAILTATDDEYNYYALDLKTLLAKHQGNAY